MKGLVCCLLLVATASVQAQNDSVWTFSRCINQAIEQNIQLKISENSEMIANYSYTESKWALAPSVSAYASGSMNFNRATDQDNNISEGNTYSASFGASASMTLFSGFRMKNQISVAKFNKLACGQSTQSATNSLVLNVATLYATALYQKAMVEVSDSIYQNSLNECNRIAGKVKVGQMQQSALSEIESTVSTNKLNLARSRNNYKLGLLQLAQAIEAESEGFMVAQTDFDAIEPHESFVTVDSIYSLACKNYPAVLQCEYELNSSKTSLKMAKGAMLPSLSASAGVGSGYYSTAVNPDGSKISFNEQASSFMSPSVGLSLNIPIFNGRSREMQVKRSKIDVENATYRLEEQKKQIRKEIESAILMLNSYYLEYESAVANVKFVNETYRAYLKKYQLGLVTITELMTAQNQLSNAQATMLQTKYLWIVQQMTLQIYSGEKIEM